MNPKEQIELFKKTIRMIYRTPKIKESRKVYNRKKEKFDKRNSE